MIEGHGDDAYRYGAEIKHNFSTNVYCGFDHSALVSYLASVAGSIKSYPEPSPKSVEKLIAQSKGIEAESVMVTNGATEAIYLIAQMFRGRKSAIVEPTFSEYRDACTIHDHNVATIGNLSEIPDDCDVVWLCNPNNPTGEVTDVNILKRYIERLPGTLFVIDSAYADYSVQPTMCERDACEYHNAVMLGSLTKRFAIPGLRIGYATGHHDVISSLRKLRMPWSVNQLAIEGAGYMLTHAEEYPLKAAELHKEALRIGEALRQLGVEVYRTDCNILLSCLPYGRAEHLKDYLATNHGILIRDASNFPTLTPRHFRVAPQTLEENDLLISAIGEWLKKEKK
ncbi:MAG: aminotransferase class I/II-fold pyridoxal phosphate-dependent enzyme [Duncaniella sp.]|nr:aminotransferase class I/II-fold pyridoxal phosphate-dependent enzyme [Duncaniella sp.]